VEEVFEVDGDGLRRMNGCHKSQEHEGLDREFSHSSLLHLLLMPSAPWDQSGSCRFPRDAFVAPGIRREVKRPATSITAPARRRSGATGTAAATVGKFETLLKTASFMPREKAMDTGTCKRGLLLSVRTSVKQIRLACGPGFTGVGSRKF